MAIVDLPPQVKIVCDDCGEALGEQEEGYEIVMGRDEVPGALVSYDWTRTNDGRVVCATCYEAAARKNRRGGAAS